MNACIYCGHPAEERDHVVPRSSGGTDDSSNLAPACQSCNRSKNSWPIEHFLRQHPEILDRVRRHQAGEDVLTGLVPGEKPRAPASGCIRPGWIEGATEGRRVQITLPIAPPLLEKVDVLARRMGQSRAAVINLAIFRLIEAEA